MRPVFVLRRSPDWSALAAASASGTTVAPDLYVPAETVPSFPARIARCIERWDATYRVGFFACRAELRAIARATLDAVDGALTLSREDAPTRLPAENFRLFFLDDDDWFAPDAGARIACAGQEDVSVFPLLRLDAPVFTFVRERTSHSPVIGLAGGFSTATRPTITAFTRGFAWMGGSASWPTTSRPRPQQIGWGCATPITTS
jgi:hypothetical protein